MAKFYGATSLTGGGTGALDAISGALLSDGDGALVIDGTSLRAYVLDDDSGLAESSPTVISPDVSPGTKRWIEQDLGWIKYLFDANSILYATTDNTPAALTVAASRIVGRKATGGIIALTGAEVLALLNTTASRILGQKAAGDCTALTDAETRTLLGLAVTDGPTLDHIHLTSGQVGFPATQVPSADVNTLDDYEEGTWTPVIQFGGSATGITYGTQVGVYTKIGNVVHVKAYIVLTSKGAQAGVALLTGLPFTAGDYYPLAVGYFGAITYANMLCAYVSSGGTHVCLVESTEAGVVSDIANTDFADTSSLMVGGSYRV